MTDATKSVPRYLDPEQIIPISRLSTGVTKTGEWSDRRPVFSEKSSPCRVDCPNGNNIPRALLAAARGDFDGVLAAFLEESPLPGVCGLVCHHPCQNDCNRIGLDGAVSIRLLERTAAELGTAAPSALSDEGRHKPVAVVGAGPAGLAAAYHLARLGHPVTVFEAEVEIGGLLRHGLPEFRLPKGVLDRELDRLRALPVSWHTGVVVGPALAGRLGAEYGATFLASGAQRDLPLGVPGEELRGVGSALDFLKRPDLQTAAKGARVVVVGGGNTAMDAARLALRRGAREVLVLYRRGPGELPAFADEVEEAREEGVAFRFLAGPVAFLGAEGKVTAVRCLEMECAHGRGRPPVPVPGSEFETPCDLVLSATGQAPLLAAVPEGLRAESGRLWTDGRGRTGTPSFFAGGDLVQSRGSVVEALASGKRGALAIHLALTRGSDDTPWLGAELGSKTLSLQAFFQPPAHWEPEAVVRLDELDYLGCTVQAPLVSRRREVQERVADFAAVSLPAARDEAVAEAERCFFCGTCVECEKCRLYCPDSSLAPTRRLGGSTSYDPDDTYCKGCGICAEACPRGVLLMSEAARP